ncbi:hypothetical protein RJT34_24746 [Clitoria ternatea]|uniref:Uncharacterized protein n=1 Tax=Clitoria ternatea TaxID=43366 RepID=A0AAN9FNM5_CLITE
MLLSSLFQFKGSYISECLEFCGCVVNHFTWKHSGYFRQQTAVLSYGFSSDTISRKCCFMVSLVIYVYLPKKDLSCFNLIASRAEHKNN